MSNINRWQHHWSKYTIANRQKFVVHESIFDERSNRIAFLGGFIPFMQFARFRTICMWGVHDSNLCLTHHKQVDCIVTTTEMTQKNGQEPSTAWKVYKQEKGKTGSVFQISYFCHKLVASESGFLLRLVSNKKPLNKDKSTVPNRLWNKSTNY